MTGVSTIEKEVLTHLQRGIEPVERPFRNFGIPEAEVVALLRRLLDRGIIRRFGGIFDARRLGYRSVLCALDVPNGRIEEKAEIVFAYPGVTHCYERRLLHGDGSWPTLWFTFAMLHDEFEPGWETLRLKLETENSKLLQLPALRRFKIDVVFDLTDSDETVPGLPLPAAASADASLRRFSDPEKALVRAMDQQVPLTETPFAVLADSVGLPQKDVLTILKDWKAEGVLRRVGAVLYHRRAGFKANAMCVWPVDGNLSAAGRRVAARPEVTHCYQRPRSDAFPFDLYAMIHSGSWPETDALFRNISADCGLFDGRMFGSVREFKKSSMQYFK